MKSPWNILTALLLLCTETREVRGQQHCSICGGESQTVTAPDRRIFDTFRNRTISCSLLEFEANFALIPQEICSNYSAAYAKQCQCVSSPTTMTSSSLPPSVSPLVSLVSCPSSSPYYNNFPSCDICGPGMEMTSTYVYIVDVPQGCPIKSCQQLQDEGYAGQISESYCQDLQTHSVRKTCGCHALADPYSGNDTAGEYNSASPLEAIFIFLGMLVSALCTYFFLNHRARSSSETSSLLLLRSSEAFSSTTMMNPASTRNHENIQGDPNIRKKVLQVLFPQQIIMATTSGGDSKYHDPLSSSHRSSGDMSGDDIVACSICLDRIVDEDQNIITGSCSHAYHRDCLMDWLHRNNNDCCPLCRQRMWEPDTFAMIEEHIQRLPDDTTKEVALGTA